MKMKQIVLSLQNARPIHDISGYESAVPGNIFTGI
jgi:hypothetical protein